jgi:hypothetical protein
MANPDLTKLSDSLRALMADLGQQKPDWAKPNVTAQERDLLIRAVDSLQKNLTADRRNLIRLGLQDQADAHAGALDELLKKLIGDEILIVDRRA